MWTSPEEIENNLKKLSSKIDALKLQINFRKKVLGQTHPDKSIFQFSVNHKPHCVQQLFKNLLTLLAATGSSVELLSVQSVENDPELLIYCRIIVEHPNY